MPSSFIPSLVQLLQAQGMRAGLRQLNDRVPHRFTAIYQLDGPLLRNVHFIDKAGGGSMDDLQAVPLEDSFCKFVFREGYFLTGASSCDERLAGHPYQGVVGSYVGLPLMQGAGRLYGSFCHFDFQDVPLPASEFELLQRVVRVLPRFL